MSREVGHNLFFLAIIQFYLNKCFVKPDTLNATLCQYSLIIHIIQLVFDGTAATI